MRRIITKGILIAVLAFFAGSVSADKTMKMASEVMEPAPDPKKKKAGEECKTADECQRHHACSKAGEKNVCTAPPRHKIPPGAVT
jgi:hypothetical protein